MKVLVPLDGSDVTYRALERGLAIVAPHPKATITLLVVMSKHLRDMPKDAREHLEFDDEDELFLREDEAKAVLEKAQTIAKKAGAKSVKPLLLTGKVKESILAEAANHDLLLMHGLDRDDRDEQRRGSATEELARTVGCSVLLVRA